MGVMVPGFCFAASPYIGVILGLYVLAFGLDSHAGVSWLAVVGVLWHRKNASCGSQSSDAVESKPCLCAFVARRRVGGARIVRNTPHVPPCLCANTLASCIWRAWDGCCLCSILHVNPVVEELALARIIWVPSGRRRFLTHYLGAIHAVCAAVCAVSLWRLGLPCR